MPVPDEDLEWAVRLGLEARRRVKEQRIGAAEFRNTHFSYVVGEAGVEQFVSTPELRSEGSIGTDPLPPGQIWTIGPGGMDEYPGLFRIEVNSGPGSHVKVLNRPAPAPFMESVRYAEQNLYARGRDLVGINLGGSIEPIHNAVSIARQAVEKGATALLVPVSARRQLYELSDDMATRVDIQFYSDPRDALLKAIVE
jgi:ATP-dependent Lon protease